MTSSIKRGLAVVAFFAIGFLLAAGVRGAESQQPAPGTASQADPATPAQPSQRQFSQAANGPCQGMMGGMARMRKGPFMMPGMGGMMGMGMPGPMGMPGRMGMPEIAMGGPGMMHQRMMMRMMARNPKLAGKMLEMRADMMRAIADVLTKYGKEMESGQWPAAKDKDDD